MKVCRICLSKDGRLYPITSNGLRSLYHQLTGLLKIEMDVDKRLPQWVCAECGLRLMSYNKLRQKSLRAHQILCQLLDRVTNITEEDINQIDREENYLKSNLNYAVKGNLTIEEYGADNQGTDFNDSKPKIEEVVIEVGGSASVFKIEKDSSVDSNSEPAISDTDNNADSDTNSDYSTSSVNKIVKILSSNRINTEYNNVQLDIKTGVDRDINTLSKNIRKRKNNLPVQKVTKNIKKERNKIKKLVVKKDKKVVVRKDKNIVVKKECERAKKFNKKVKKEIKKKDSVPEDSIEDVFEVETLSLEEASGEFEKRKNFRKYTNAQFKCDDCFEGFVSEVKYAKHNLLHSDKWGKHKCKVCKRRFRTMHFYCLHMNAHRTAYRCKECNFRASPMNLRARTLAVLHRLKHKGKTYKCPHCDLEFNATSTYWKHLRIKHVSDFVCEYCGFSFISALGVFRHKNLKHALEKNKIVSSDGPTCTKCKIRFHSDKALNTHLRVSHTQNPELKKRNSAKQSMEYTGYGKRKNLTILCELCGVETADARVYRGHFRRHHPHETPTNFPKQPFMCDQCGAVFQSKTNLLNHALVHTGQKPYECDYCNKKFKSKYHVQAHIIQVHLPKKLNRKVYPCGICGKEFNMSNNRTRHMVTVHTDLRPFNCEICGNSFKTKGEVTGHTKHVHLKKPWPRKNKKVSNLSNTGLPAYSSY